MSVQPRKCKRNLPCILTDDEKADYSAALVDLMQEAEELETEKKRVAEVFKRKINGNKDSQDTIAGKLRSGQEDRLVECEVRYFQPDLRSKQTVRLDTGDVIETAPMTEDEKQLTMFPRAEIEPDEEETEESSEEAEEATEEEADEVQPEEVEKEEF